MKSWTSVVLLATLIRPAFGQNSFEQYVELSSKGKLGSREALFAKKCGIERKAAKVTYGESLNDQFTFRTTKGLGSPTRDAETDSFGTAEVWLIAGQPRLLSLWMLTLDTGYYSNELFCLDTMHRFKLQETLNAYAPVDGSSGGWIHLQKMSFDRVGNKQIELKRFVGASGSSITDPRLEPDDLEQSSTSSSTQFAAKVIEKLKGKSR